MLYSAAFYNIAFKHTVLRCSISCFTTFCCTIRDYNALCFLTFYFAISYDIMKYNVESVVFYDVILWTVAIMLQHITLDSR